MTRERTTAVRSVAWFASLPPADDPVARLTARVVRSLAERVEVHCFTTAAAPESRAELDGYATVHQVLDNPDLWPSVHACDIAVFHLDCTAQIHGGAFDLSCQHPGVVVLHDSSLHELVAWSWALYQGRVDHYLDTVEHEHGRAGRLLAERWRSGEVSIGEIAEQVPMTSWIGRRALGVVAIDETTWSRLRPEVATGHLGPLTLAERDLDPEDWVDRFLELATEAHRRRVTAAVRVFTDRVGSWGWLPGHLRRRAVDRLAPDLAEIVRLGDG